MRIRRFLAGSLLVLGLLAAPAAHAASGANCFTVIVGRDASATGAVLLAHNEDDLPPEIVNWYKVPHLHHAPGELVHLKDGATLPQAPETAAYIWAEMPGQEFADSYMNEYGVTIVSNQCPSKVRQADLTDGGIGYWLRRLMAERAHTAREAVEIAGRLIERFGYHSTGRTYSIADPREAWMLAAVRGRLWVAERIPDDSMAVLANRYTIDTIDLGDSRNFLGSPRIVPFAREHGWYDPGHDGAFSFRTAYGDPRATYGIYNVGRQWRGVTVLSGKEYRLGEDLPFASRPARKIRLEDLFGLLRDHFEGTELESRATFEHGDPHGHYVKRICSRTTQYGIVAELRSGLPPAAGAVLWLAPRRPCIQPFVPVYSGITGFPRGFARSTWRDAIAHHFIKDTGRYTPVNTLAYWAFFRRAARIDAAYTRLAPAARSRRDRLEGAVFLARRQFEARIVPALRRNRKTALTELTRFSATWLEALWDLNRAGLAGP